MLDKYVDVYIFNVCDYIYIYFEMRGTQTV